MKQCRRHIIALMFVATLGCGVFAPSAQGNELLRFELENQMLDLINEARANPLETAAAMGMDPEALLADLPELAEILRNGLPPLCFNADLRRAARDHSNDMMARDYYGSVTPEGETPEARVRAAGYIPEKIGESLGVFGFFNFIPPRDAVDRIFENMFREELTPDSAQRNILSPEMEEAGIGFDGGVLTLSGVRHNVYLFVCDFGKSRVAEVEQAFLSLVNQARANPLAAAIRLGLDPEQVLADLPDVADSLQTGMPLLRMDESLHFAARAHAADMLENDYYMGVSPDGLGPFDRAAAAGYDPVAVLETKRLVVLTDSIENPFNVARINFERMLKREFSPGYGERVLLNPDLHDAGVAIATLSPEYWQSIGIESVYDPYHVQMVVMDAGASRGEAKGPNLAGRVVVDWNQDGGYDCGEWVPGVAVSVIGGAEEEYVLTDRTGAFSLRIEAGDREVRPMVATVPEAANVQIETTAGKWVDFEVFVPETDEEK